MSLINDALKKRQEAEQAAPPPKKNLDFRPPEPSPEAETDGTQRFLWTLVLTVAALNLVLWLIYNDKEKEPEVQARARSTTPSAAVSEPVSPADAPEAESEPVAEAAPAARVITNPAPAHLVEEGSSSNWTKTPAGFVVHQEEAKPTVEVPLRLQSVIFHPTRPSAVVNGQMVFVGDSVNGNRVKTIRRNQVILVKGTQIRTLTLP